MVHHSSPSSSHSLPPVRVNLSASCRADDVSVKLVPGYKGFVARSREVFGKTYGNTTEALPTGSRRSLFKPTVNMAKRIRVDLPDEHPQAVLQKTSWTQPADYDNSPPRPLFSSAEMYLTTNRIMQDKTDTTGTPEDDIRMIPGYSGHVHTHRETFGATWGSAIRPLKDRPAPDTKATLLTPRGSEKPSRNSKGLQVHSKFTVPLTPREKTSIARAVEKASGRPASEVLSLRGGERLDDTGAIITQRPGVTTLRAKSARPPPKRPVYASSSNNNNNNDNNSNINSSHSYSSSRPATSGLYSPSHQSNSYGSNDHSSDINGKSNGKNYNERSVSFEAKSHRERVREGSRYGYDNTGASGSNDIPKVDASAFRPPLVGKKPRNAKVVNSLFNVGRGGYMGQDAEKAASSFHVKNRPFGSQFKVHVPEKTTPYGQRFDKM